MKRFDRQVVHLADLARETSILDGFEFVDCDVYGPAVLLPVGGCTFQENKLEGPAVALLWEIPPERDEVIGAIGVKDSTFLRCRFHRVGLAGHPDFIFDFIGGSTSSD